MDGIIFDIDGTLWDSTESVAKAWNHAIIEHANLDLHLTGTSLMPLFGKTMDEIEAALFPEQSARNWEMPVMNTKINFCTKSLVFSFRT